MFWEVHVIPQKDTRTYDGTVSYSSVEMFPEEGYPSWWLEASS